MRYLFFGTYTQTRTATGSQGIYTYAMDETTGRLTEVAAESSCANPSYVIVSRANGCLYACSEQGDSAAVFAYRIDPASGRLALINSLASPGTALCHLAADSSGRLLFGAHYLSGNIAVYALNADGSLGGMLANFQHEGRSVDEKRQEGPHAHSVTLSPDEKTAYAADLGLDKIVLYAVDKERGAVQPNRALPFVAVEPGEGPRHMAFHPNGRYLYLATEMGNSVVVFGYDAPTGALELRQKLGTLPADFTGTSYAADIHCSPDGRWLYVSNRGHDSIVRYAVEPVTGRLSAAAWTPSHGRWPRNFAISPDGRWMVITNQFSGNAAVCPLSPETGAPGEPVQDISIPQPSCAAFFEG